MSALERMPERRYQTARELQMDLEGFARDQKMQISSAALAEWMETTFGPKREIWHSCLVAAQRQQRREAAGAPRRRGKVPHAELANIAPPTGDAIRGRAPTSCWRPRSRC